MEKEEKGCECLGSCSPSEKDSSERDLSGRSKANDEAEQHADHRRCTDTRGI